MSEREKPPARPVELLVEEAPGGAAFGHIPRLSGLCLRAGDSAQLQRIATSKVIQYVRWLVDEDLADLTPLGGLTPVQRQWKPAPWTYQGLPPPGGAPVGHLQDLPRAVQMAAEA